MPSVLTYARRQPVTCSTEGVLSLCGIVAPPLFALTVVVAGRVYPGYSHMTQAISELGGVGAPVPAIQNANFVFLGLLMMAFALGMMRRVNQSVRARLGVSLIATFGAACIANGVLMCDRGCDFVSTVGTAHNLTGMTGFLAILVAVALMARVFAAEREWADLKVYSQVTAVVGFICLVLWIGVAKAAGIGAVNGILQRLFVACVLIWVEVAAIRLFTLSRR